MQLSPNRFKQGLKSGRTQIGIWTNLGSDLIAEIAADADYDWLLMDMEHSAAEVGDILRLLQAVGGRRIVPIVRPPSNDPVMVKRLLDIGCQTFLIPFVQNAEEARRAVAATRYPPSGIRGVAASTRASRFGRVVGYAQKAADEICVLVQIETREALCNLEEIAAVSGVDGIFIGPSDLAASCGYLGRAGEPAMKELIDETISRIRATGQPAGILAPVEADARRWIDQGAAFVSVGVDASMMVRAMLELHAQFRPNSC